MVLLSSISRGGSMSAGKENTPVLGSGNESSQGNREEQLMGGAKDLSQSQLAGEHTSVVSYAPSSTERSNGSTTVAPTKANSLLKEKYSGGRREECEDRVDADSVNSDKEGMSSRMHDMESLSLYHSPPPPGMADGSLHEFAMQQHRLGLMSNMRNKALSPETSELLRGILQGKEKRLADRLSPHGSGGDSALISKLLHGDGEQHLLRNGSFDGDESLPCGSPGNLSSDDSDLENHNSEGGMNGNSCELSPNCEKRKLDDSSSTGSVGDSQEAKRARVENIITMMQSPPRPPSENNNSSMEQRRPKRKQYIPQQHDVYSDHSSPKVRKLEQEVIKKQLKLMQDQLAEMQQRYSQIFDFEGGDAPCLPDFTQGEHTNEIRRPNGVESERIENNKDLIKKPGFGMGDRPGEFDPSHYFKQAKQLVKEQEIATKRSSPSLPNAPADLKNLAKTLKDEITNSVGSLVDSIVARYVEQQKTSVEKQTVINLAESVKEKLIKSTTPTPEEEKPRQNSPKPVRTKVTDKISHPFLDLHKNFPEMPRMHPAMQHLFAPPPYFPTQVPSIHSLYPKEPEQAEPLSLVVSNTPKKKRTKVTDTRLSPRAARALLQDTLSQPPPPDMEKHHMPHHPLPHLPHVQHHHHAPPEGFHPPLVPVTLPTSVAIPNPSLQHSDVLAMYSHPGEHAHFEPNRNSSHSPNVGDHGSPNMAHTPGEGMGMSLMKHEDSYDHPHHPPHPLMMPEMQTFDGTPMTSTLTPMHLRKAKLMFFYTRYPSSAILKIYFPDVKFNKNNTAQLVKWFSNFREFYYIQMEKYARQALAEGVKNGDDLVVTLEHELYRVLNLHYNRNNQIEVPDHFRLVVQATLREFFKAIQAGKDSEQSWKKAIYKIIARMDDTIPEYFKSPNWMEQLSDM